MFAPALISDNSSSSSSQLLPFVMISIIHLLAYALLLLLLPRLFELLLTAINANQKYTHSIEC